MASFASPGSLVEVYAVERLTEAIGSLDSKTRLTLKTIIRSAEPEAVFNSAKAIDKVESWLALLASIGCVPETARNFRDTA